MAYQINDDCISCGLCAEESRIPWHLLASRCSSGQHKTLRKGQLMESRQVVESGESKRLTIYSDRKSVCRERV